MNARMNVFSNVPCFMQIGEVFPRLHMGKLALFYFSEEPAALLDLSLIIRIVSQITKHDIIIQADLPDIKILILKTLLDFNPYPAKLIYLNFPSLEVVSRYRDPQLQVGENYSHLFTLSPNIYTSLFSNTNVIPNNCNLTTVIS